MKTCKLRLALACILGVLLCSGYIAKAEQTSPPANDNCQNATAIEEVVNRSFNTTNATFDGSGNCVNSPNIWYRYTATRTGNATVSLCGSSYDTMLAVYSGSACYPQQSDMIGCNDDACGRQSELSFSVVAGNQYLIEAGGYGGETGHGVISISCDWEPPQELHSGTLSEALDITLNFATGGSADWFSQAMTFYYDEDAAQSGGLLHNQDSWMQTTVSEAGTVSFYWKVSSENRYDFLEFYIDGSLQDRISGTVDWQQMTYAITASGSHTLKWLYTKDRSVSSGNDCGWVDKVEWDGDQLNDDCINAIAIGNVTNLPFDTSEAQFDGPGHCMTSQNIWYCYTAPSTGDVTVSLCGSEYDTKLAIYNGCGCNPTAGKMIECNDDFCGRQSEITFAAIAGNKYLIEIGGWTESDKGQGVLNVSVEGGPGPQPWPPNDDCNNAKPVGDVTNQPFDTSEATFDGPGQCINSPNIWYRYTATCTGAATVSLCGSGYDTKLAVYNEPDCNPSSSNLIGCNDDACGWQSEITFEATAGKQYLIEVGGFGSNTGEGVISISCEGTAQVESDLGDAPDSTNNFGTNMTAYPKGGPSGVRAHYPTVYDDGSSTGPYGPIHLNHLAVAHLGRTITHETEADSGQDQDGINNIKPRSNSPDNDRGDDGVIFPLNMPQCRWTTLDYIVNVISPDTNLWVNVWCDWNRDGDWDDDSSTDEALICTKGFVSEWTVQNQYLFNLQVGSNQLTTPAFLSCQPFITPKKLWMRVTLSEKPWTGGSDPGSRGNGGSGPQDGYEIGETEDYYFMPDTSRTICEDFNGDGVINLEDLVAFTTDWLESCPK